ncbi:hypothetical protein D3C74_304850 [compost metagenome]
MLEYIGGITPIQIELEQVVIHRNVAAGPKGSQQCAHQFQEGFLDLSGQSIPRRLLLDEFDHARQKFHPFGVYGIYARFVAKDGLNHIVDGMLESDDVNGAFAGVIGNTHGIILDDVHLQG